MTTPEQKAEFERWVTQLRNNICAELEKLEEECDHDYLLPGQFRREIWQRHDKSQQNGVGGGGTMSILKGRVFEKAGVNISTVYGQFPEQFAKEIPGAEEDPSFWACGISLVIHPLNPFVPAVHMNTRHIVTHKTWFGGGADLTPTFEFAEDTRDFHQAFREACDRHNPDYYAKFKLWCDEYFYLPHRNEARGVGGIFYDYINTGSFDADYAFTRDVGLAFLKIYPELVRRHYRDPWTAEDKQKQLIKRGRYTEFNLLYDRGTKFGLKTNGNVDAILMSLPPVAMW
ncbi:oxygen-dependent coproporphyrinogen oxidase [Candidatus Odyssella thessalonicensis]|uniref:oxygen-dependent coproporphyrinogen oxidase n=1 Tax=Candidatus Odyssella thessalonicensis TaxID=84647 RepID=UPI000225BADA|nr:oxygen-dependent coproporphyrinogen oxidase [Candidatus Odyssella thessalonicensis]